MRALFRAGTSKQQKTCATPWIPFQGGATRRQPGSRSANLLYKRTLTGAASRRGKIVRSLHSAGNSYLQCMRSGPGKKTNRSASQAGHGTAKRFAEQKIYGRRFSV